MRARATAWEWALRPWVGCKSEYETKEQCLQETFFPGLGSVSWYEHPTWVSKHYRTTFGNPVMGFKGRSQIVLEEC